MNKANVKVRLNTLEDSALVEKESPDVLIVAVGSEWNNPFKGAARTVVSGKDVLSGRAEPGERVAVVGGGSVGCETALHIAEVLGRKVTVIEMLPQVLAGEDLIHVMVLMERLQKAGIELIHMCILDDLCG